MTIRTTRISRTTGTTQQQISEIEFFTEDNKKINIIGASNHSINIDGTENELLNEIPHSESVENAIDGNINTKWFSENLLFFTFQANSFKISASFPPAMPSNLTKTRTWFICPEIAKTSDENDF